MLAGPRGIVCGESAENAAPAHAVVAYDAAANHAGDGANVLFGDGRVVFVGARQLAAVLASTAPPKSRPAATAPSMLNALQFGPPAR